MYQLQCQLSTITDQWKEISQLVQLGEGIQLKICLEVACIRVKLIRRVSIALIIFTNRLMIPTNKVVEKLLLSPIVIDKLLLISVKSQICQSRMEEEVQGSDNLSLLIIRQNLLIKIISIKNRYLLQSTRELIIIQPSILREPMIKQWLRGQVWRKELTIPCLSLIIPANNQDHHLQLLTFSQVMLIR